MSANLKQVYDANPSSELEDSDLIYAMRSPYTAGTDTGITYEDLAAQITSGVQSLPYQIFWASPTGSPTGNGSESSPFDTGESAYLAGAGTGQPFLVGFKPGAYNEPSFDVAITINCGFFAEDPLNTSVVFGDVTLDQTDWLDPGTFFLAGLTISANSWNLSVPTGGVADKQMQNVIFKNLAGEVYKWENFNNSLKIINCDLSNVAIKMVANILWSINSIYSSFTPTTYDPDVGLPVGNSTVRVYGGKMNSIFAKATSENNLILNIISLDTINLSNFFVEGADTITIRKPANLQDPTVTSGTPTIQNIDSAANINAAYSSPTNYTPTSNRVLGHLEGINNALGFGGMEVVEVTTGYQEVEPNKLYYTRSAGKVIFQTPVNFPKDKGFGIIGASESQCSWELYTQLGHSLIYQDVLTDIDPTIFAIAKPSYYRDVAMFMCINENVEFQCVDYDGSGLQLSQEISVFNTLPTQSVAEHIIYAPALVVDGYTGYIAKVKRSGDSATAFLSKDFANRASLLSETDGGSILADWGLGQNISIQFIDQSSNGFNAFDSGEALWIDSTGSMATMSTGRTCARTVPPTNYMQAAFTAYTDDEFTVLVCMSRTNESTASSVATLYDPANGDDYGSTLNNVAFYEENDDPTFQFRSIRDGDLSIKSFTPTLNTRMIVSNRFDGANNTMTVNGSAGTAPASTGAFSFNKALIGARYVSGGITDVGDYKIGFWGMYSGALSPAEIADLTAYIDTFL